LLGQLAKHTVAPWEVSFSMRFGLLAPQQGRSVRGEANFPPINSISLGLLCAWYPIRIVQSSSPRTRRSSRSK